jgi:mRNA interferase MazF
VSFPKPWEVWVVPFPYTDRLEEKRRPALVISKQQLLQDHGLVWLAMITSTRINAWTSDITVSDLAAAGLPIPSRIRVAKIAALEPKRMVRRLGRLSHRDATAAAQAMDGFLAAP